VNFELLQLRIHMRRLYERLGAMDAELVIVRAFDLEIARHDRIRQLQQDKDNHARLAKSTRPCA
jgi:hypothetical protein